MATCSCTAVMQPTADGRGAYCEHCDRVCKIRYCTPCRALTAAEGRGPRTKP